MLILLAVTAVPHAADTTGNAGEAARARALHAELESSRRPVPRVEPQGPPEAEAAQAPGPDSEE